LQEYDELVAEFVGALKAREPPVLLQWEDFGNENAFRWVGAWAAWAEPSDGERA
jgi:hypothetical protein